jgi:hypothetical protein
MDRSLQMTYIKYGGKQKGVAVSDFDQFVASTELASAETCVNCIYLQSQLSRAIEELKSLQTIISLLQI